MNTYPLLGVEGYRNIVAECRERNIDLPILAVGGIRLEDVAPLMQTGIFGIAVSGAINHSEQPGQTAKEFYRAVHL